MNTETDIEETEADEIRYDQFQPDAGYESDDELRDMYAQMRRRGAILIWLVVLLMLAIVIIGVLSDSSLQ